VAAQYLASDLNDQAVEVLRQALQRMPERTDLRLQLARALWRGGRQVDAAESAIEVLDKLPYALVANRILTELWLQEDRPSDAQRYLSRIEDVDPYLAFASCDRATHARWRIYAGTTRLR
jgi:predicted Zn-dependent protease